MGGGAWDTSGIREKGVKLLVVVDEGDGLSRVIHEGGEGVLVPGNVINTVGTIVVPVHPVGIVRSHDCHVMEAHTS